MLRKIIFKDTETGSELVLPVTPEQYQAEHGHKAVSLDMYSVGQVNLPGDSVQMDETLECLLPAHDYPFLVPGAGTDPWEYIEQLEKWSDEGTVLRFIVSDTPVNAAVILDPIVYREKGGTNDITCTIPMRGYRELTAEETESVTGNAARAVETEPTRQSTYVVQSGDTLAGICRRFYGNSSLYVKLAAANGISNVNLISVGQVLTLPTLDGLTAVKAAASNTGKVSTASTASSSTVVYVKVALTFMGASSEYFGKGSISYADSAGRTGTTTVTSSVTVLVPKGSSVTVRWEALNGHSADYRFVNGNKVTNSNMVSFLNPISDNTIIIHWVK
ncbi:hypothetical protein SDC9_57901 [bioreactor metagenome]|uniref:LysM domain-containing protein n=1 Tax=bioreactor metagenome TaxID=1076179 RepID=A0A644X5Z4_9ZZZZ